MMLSNLLFIFGFVIILIAYINIFVIYLKYRNNRIDDVTGFDLAKEITSNYDEINIVESKKVLFSQYNFKRGIIRLLPQNYEDNGIFSLAIVSQLSLYSLRSVDNNNFKLFKIIFPSIDWVNKSGIIATFVCYFAKQSGDAKIALVFLLLILIYQYFIIQMNDESRECLRVVFDDVKMRNVIKALNGFYFLHKCSFVVTLIFMLRVIVIILGL